MSTHTIGEVLTQLKDEFEDVTISKIRFLESEGLISPDRTESGYRKFSAGDVDRLRYILRAQRDRYLPLKVIRDELERIDAGVGPPPEAATAASPPPPLGVGDGAATGEPVGADHAAPLLAIDAEPTPARREDAPALAAELGLDPTTLRKLQDNGLLRPGDRLAPDDAEALRLATRLLGHGLEPRHLRMFRQFADREAALYEQLVTPLLRQRNPDSRAEAVERLTELHDVGGRLHAILLAGQLRALLGA